jgi:D-alanine-D-alanine ligase
MKKTIAVIFGGKSAEHDVSIITGHYPIISSLIATGKYDVIPVYISKDGSWYSEQSMNEFTYFQVKDIDTKVTKLKKLSFSFDGGFSLIWPGGLRPRQQKIDVVFPAMHGTYGEDGSLMGMLRMANVPFVGCDLIASAVAMDKALTKLALDSAGVPIVPFVWFSRGDWAVDRKELLVDSKKLRLPLFVKPVHLGSSIAITKIKTYEELENAIEVALHYDDKVLVEEGVENLIEVTLPMMGNDKVQFANIERPLNQTEFFDFSDKYLSGGKKLGGGESLNGKYSELPAKLDKKLSDMVLDYGEKTYKTLGCSGIARVDFLIDGKKNEVYVNEVNTLPGGLYDHNWRSVGVSGVELVEGLIALAEERYKQNSNTVYSFSSEILSSLDSAKLQKN